MNKKGQIQISFGMIFSIIIVIATVAIGFYVISYFLNLSSCTKTGLFWDSLNGEVEKAYNADITQTVFNGDIPSGIEYVCFGNLTSSQPQGSDTTTAKIFNELKVYGQSDKNAFLYPPKKACDFAFSNLKHASASEFFCVPVKSGVASVRMSFESGTNDRVVLSKP